MAGGFGLFDGTGGGLLAPDTLEADGFLPAGTGGGPLLAGGGGGGDDASSDRLLLSSAGYGGGGLAVPASFAIRGGNAGGAAFAVTLCRDGRDGGLMPLPVRGGGGGGPEARGAPAVPLLRCGGGGGRFGNGVEAGACVRRAGAAGCSTSPSTGTPDCARLDA